MAAVAAGFKSPASCRAQFINQTIRPFTNGSRKRHTAPFAGLTFKPVGYLIISIHNCPGQRARRTVGNGNQDLMKVSAAGAAGATIGGGQLLSNKNAALEALRVK